MICQHKECLNYDTAQCSDCRRNMVIPSDRYVAYIPVCPKCYNDCVCDPAYIKYHYPDWYKELYGDMTPEEAAAKHCDPTNDYCYDDEDK